VNIKKCYQLSFSFAFLCLNMPDEKNFRMKPKKSFHHHQQAKSREEYSYKSIRSQANFNIL